MSKESNHHTTKDPGTIDAWALVYFLHDHAVVILFCALLGLLSALLYAKLATPVFESHAILEVASAAPASIGGMSRREPTAVDSAAVLKTVEQSLTSPSVLDRVIDAQHLADDPNFAAPGDPHDNAALRRQLQKRVSASLVRGTRLISVTARSRSPEKARDLAKAVVDAFFAKNIAEQHERSASAREYLLSEVHRQAEELRRAEERMQDFREKAGLVGLPDQRSIDVNYLGNLHAQLSQATSERLRLESVKTQVEAALATGDPEKLLKLQPIAETPEIAKLRQQRDDAATAVAALAERYRAKHPAMVQAQRKLTETTDLLDQTARNTAESILHAYQAAKGTEQKLQEAIDARESQSVDAARVGIEYRALEREVNSDTALYQQLLDRLKEADVTRNITEGLPFSGSLVELSEAPQVPDYPTRFSLKIILPAGLLGGALLGILLALLRRALDDSVASVDAAESCLGIDTLAVVPLSRRIAFRRGRLRKPEPGLPEAEPFRSLRTSLSLMAEQRRSRIIMFTSAVSGEGKSCCSTNYATVVAQSGLRTLLIDGDLRRPQLRRAFNLQKYNVKPDVAAVLAKPELFDEAIDQTAVPNLHLLGSTRGNAHAADLVANGRLNELLRVALDKFDYVVVDTAPVAVVSDALHFARQISTICLVVHARRTPRRVVQRAAKLLTDVAGREPTGVILNQIRRNRASHYHYYYHSSSQYTEDFTSSPAAG